MTSRPGLTLIEVLLSLTILSAMVALAGVWLVGAARASADESRHGSQQLALHRAVSVLQRDIDQATDGSFELVEHEYGSVSLRLITCHRPGQHHDDAPGWLIVTWSIDPASGSLIRTTQPSASGPEHQPIARRVLCGPVTLTCSRGPGEDNADSPVPVIAILSRGLDQAAAVAPARRLRIKDIAP